MKRECESCIKRKTPYCPTSMECMATDDMPYYQNRIMLLEENQQLKRNCDIGNENLNFYREEYKELEELLNTILNFKFFKNECPLNLCFERDTNEDKVQDVFYENEYCENTCNDDYAKCWLKYFERLKELERGVNNE